MLAPLHLGRQRHHRGTHSVFANVSPRCASRWQRITENRSDDERDNSTPADAASVSAGAGNFGVLERKRQAAFRKGLTTPTDAIGLKHDYLLALGCEEENLFPTLRGENGALPILRGAQHQVVAGDA